jgi:ectoine hydroxylase-related dioxygenase (phytanoyl-CoA dioxygenase family)
VKTAQAADSLGTYRDLGYAIMSDVLTPEVIEALIAATRFEISGVTHSRQGKPYADRSALSNPVIANLADADVVRSLASEVLGKHAFAVRAILFDKVEGANWKVPWHQDLTIAVKERHDLEGYGPWSVKEGVPHVQPPDRVLELMVAIRLHLDDCGPENGPIRVIPGSHLSGRLKESSIDEILATSSAVELTCAKGDAILMSPLLLHASSASTRPDHRRVIHIEYASCDLDPPLEWANRI